MRCTFLLFVFILIFQEGRVFSRDLAASGLIDVTAAPFNADPSGKTDCTEALQKAIDFAQKNHKVAFFPEGTYRISSTLHCRHDPPSAEDRGLFRGQRYWGITLLGSTAGKARPKILLAPRSKG